MNNIKEQIQQIRDQKKLYSITDNFYKKNNTLYIRITRKKYNYFIIYNKKLYIFKDFYEALPFIRDNNKSNKQWAKDYSKECKYYQTIYFFDQIINE